MKTTTQNIMRIIRVSMLHALIWSFLFSLNYLLIQNYQIKFDFAYEIFSWLIYIVLFYINFYVLMPFLLFRKRYFFYTLGVVAILAGTYSLRHINDVHHFKQVLMNDTAFLRQFQKTYPQRKFTDKSLDELTSDKQFLKHKHDSMIIPPDGEIMPPSPESFDQQSHEFRHKDRGPNHIFFGMSGLLLMFMASTSIRFLQKWKDDEKRKSEIDKEKIANELSFLKQQMNPHFLFNALNSIYSLAISKMPETTDAILKLSSILRYMLYDTDKKLVLLNEELEVIANYISLQKLRLTEQVAVNYKVTGNPEGHKIEPLLLIPFIENAFKHGADNVNPSFISIDISIRSKELELSVKNKIVPKATYPHGDAAGGIGIRNVKRRLDLIGTDDYSLFIEEVNGIFSILLKLNLKQ